LPPILFLWRAKTGAGVLWFKKANENPNHGIQSPQHFKRAQKQYPINNLVFIIAPRVNAAGRMDDARKAVQCLYPRA
jgi:single-stranded DNA-specific DHH superfamily exonuclease